MLKNNFYNPVKTAEVNNATVEELTQLLGCGRAKKGMFEGDINNGKLKIDQVSANIKNIPPAATIVNEIWNEYNVLTTSFHK